MGKILCATRGGEASFQTQAAAIAKARETGDELVFIYIYDIDFMAHANYTLRSDVISEEMQGLAEFLLTIAVEAAKRKGVQARSLIRQGKFEAELGAAAREEQATLIVVGRPAELNNRFELENLEELAERLQRETGISVQILPEASS